MSFLKRPTEIRKIISLIDPALAQKEIPRQKYLKYRDSLDIKDLGVEDLNALKIRPVIFHCKPLRAALAHLNRRGDNDSRDFWNVFATHVDRIDNLHGDCIFRKDETNEFLHEDMREYFYDNTIRDIAEIIIALANADGDLVPFPLRGGTVDFMDALRVRHLARSRGAVAGTADAASRVTK